jgi:RNA polymerase sigma-70 factor (ECF subfamily)
VEPRQARGGQLASLDVLVREHLPAAMRFATRLSGNTHEAEEIVQEALLRAVRRINSYRGESDFRTWLWRIVINVFRDRLRCPRLSTTSVDELSEASDQGSEPDATLMARELSERIAREVSRLPPRQREVLVLVSYEGLGVPQVAELLSISQANVHSTLSAARGKLREILAAYFKSAVT